MSRGMGILLALAVLTGAYIAFDIQWTEKQEQKKSQSSLLFTMERDSVAEVEIKRGSSSLIQLKKEEGQWFIVPSSQAGLGKKELADQNSVKEFIEGIRLEKSTEVIKEGDVDWKVFGLDEGGEGQVTLSDGKGQAFVFTVGRIKNFQSEPYLRINQESKVHLVSSTWSVKLDKKLFDFRDQRWIRKDLTNLNKIVLGSAGSRWTLLKTKAEGKSEPQSSSKSATESAASLSSGMSATWILKEKPEWTLDSNKVNPLVQVFSNSKIKDLLPKPQSMKSLFKSSKEKLEFKELQVELGFADSDSVEKFKLSGQKTLRAEGDTASADVQAGNVNAAYLERESEKEIAQLDDEEAWKWLGLKVDDLRDRTKAFRFDSGKVQKIQIDLTGKKYTLVKDSNGTWGFESPSDHPQLMVDQEKTSGLSSKVAMLEVRNFLGAAADSSKIQNRLVFYDAQGEMLTSVVIGGELSKSSKNETQLTWVKTSLEKESVSVDSSRISGLNLAEVVRAKPQPSSNPDSSPKPAADSSAKKTP